MGTTLVEGLVPTVPTEFVVQSGKVDDRWNAYGLNTVDIKLRDRETGYKLIIRKGDPIAIASKGYVLIPNEVAIDAADAAALRVGAKPFTEFSGPWYVKPRDHVMMDKEEIKMAALYAWDEGVEITPRDKIHVGFSVRNGIDGYHAFQTGLFTFRHACANMFVMARMGGKRSQATGMHWDDREVMASLFKVHYGQQAELMASVDELVPVLEKSIKQGFEVIDRLRSMTTTKLTELQALRLGALPEKYVRKISGLDLEKDGTVKIVSDVTQYQVWNDITALLTHDTKGHWDTKMHQYAIAQRILFQSEDQ